MEETILNIKYCIYTLNEEDGNYDLELVFDDKETAEQVLSDMRDNLTYNSIPQVIPEFGLPKYILSEE